jgi:hypothetical protein
VLSKVLKPLEVGLATGNIAGATIAWQASQLRIYIAGAEEGQTAQAGK